MVNLEEKVDSRGRQILFKLTEKDSPYYNKNYDKLFLCEKMIHQRYKEGRVSRMNTEISNEIREKMNSEMENTRKEFISKSHASELLAANIILY